MLGEPSIIAEGQFDNEAKKGQMSMDMGDIFSSFETTGEDIADGDGNIDMVIDGTTVYEKSPLFESVGEKGKPWMKADLADLADQGALSGSAQSEPAAFLRFLEGAGDDSSRSGARASGASRLRLSPPTWTWPSCSTRPRVPSAAISRSS